MLEIIALSTPLTLNTGEVSSINFTVMGDNASQDYSIPRDAGAFPAAQALLAARQAGTLAGQPFTEALIALADKKAKIEAKMAIVDRMLTKRISLKDGHLFVDFTPVDSTIETHVLRLLREDGTPRDRSNWNAFAAFLEKLYTNTDPYVRDQLFGWLSYENFHGQGFTITSDGDLIGYKGVALLNGEPYSRTHGQAFVNGVLHDGQIPNPLGAIVGMERSKVQADPAVGCSTGLHVGTFNYAKGFAVGAILKIKFSPADVVSVPVECSAQKVRVFRYQVMEIIDAPDTKPVAHHAVVTPRTRKPITQENDLSDGELEDLASEVLRAHAASSRVSFTYYDKPRTGFVVEGDYTSEGHFKLKEDDGQVKTYRFIRMFELTVEKKAQGKHFKATKRFKKAEAAMLAKELVTFTRKGEELAGYITHLRLEDGTWVAHISVPRRRKAVRVKLSKITAFSAPRATP